MSEPQKYMFGSSFIGDDGQVLMPDVENARNDGFARGRLAGLEEEKNYTGKLVEKLSMKIAELAQDQIEAHTYLNTYVLEITKSIVCKLMPYLMAKDQGEELKQFVTSCLKNLNHKGSLQIIVNPEKVSPIEEITNQMMMQGMIDCEISVKGNDQMEPCDCQLKWDDGGLRRIYQEIEQQIQHVLQAIQTNCPKPQESIKNDEPELIQEEENNVRE